MNILIVGNVLKDVYLNLDSRTADFEVDKHNVKWLNVGFNASEHFFYSRHSSLGGAAVTLDVLRKMGIEASISASKLKLEEDEKAVEAAFYRYILVSDEGVSYLAPIQTTDSLFASPANPVDYIYVDRSAHLSQKVAEKIASYLDEHKETKFVAYVKKNNKDPYLKELTNRADLLFVESMDGTLHEDMVLISDSEISYKDIKETVLIERVDKLTHLSAYSIMAATILGGFVLGETVEESLKMAKANVENSNLDSVLTLEEMKNLATMPAESIELIAASLVAPKKGILAADESGGSIKKKFAELEIEDTFENRHDYRNIFLTTPDLEQYVNGVILFDETARDKTDNGMPNVDYLISRRIIPGIKVDQGLEKFENSEETWTKGLNDLPERLREYYGMGLRFAKWRAAFNLTLDENGEVLTPTEHAISENCKILAEYAKDCQSAGLVPIVEPEVVYDGYYPIERNIEVTSRILDCLFDELENFEVKLEACVLKVNMVLAGKKFETQSTPEEVGKATADVLKNHVPEKLAGVVFLSGGQTVEQATANLGEVIKNGPFPWPVTFSFARALQDPALYAWHGDINNAEEAKQAFKERLIENTKVL